MPLRFSSCLRSLFLHSSFAVVCSLAAAAASAADGEVILFDAHVFTAEPAHPYADAVAIRGDRIVGVGALSAVAAMVGPNAKRVDLKGGS